VNPTDRAGQEEAEAAPAAALAGAAPHAAPHASPYVALRSRDFRLLLAGRFLATLGSQMVTVAVGWELYNRTGSAFALGLVGLVQIVPVLLLSLPAGHIADRVDRKRVVLVAELLNVGGALGLALVSFFVGPLPVFYGCLLLLGIANAFQNPASTALMSQTVAPEYYANAATWSSSSWQLASVVGPALGGLLIAQFLSAAPVYAADMAMGVAYALLLAGIHARYVARGRGATALRSLAEGVGFVWGTKVILAAITLDMFAVLLGGATTLLPVYAKDILQVGPVGLGWMEAAPSIGAVTMALLLAHLPPFRRAGRALLLAIIGFGAATVVFGLSTSFPLSLAMLALLGALDNVSVVVRSTLLLVRTPDELRGRIAAVNSIFVGASNQLGGFESGLVAQFFTPAISVVGGGVGTILVVLAVALIFPQIRRLGRLAPDVKGA